jgi:hypothetical protein
VGDTLRQTVELHVDVAVRGELVLDRGAPAAQGREGGVVYELVHFVDTKVEQKVQVREAHLWAYQPVIS